MNLTAIPDDGQVTLTWTVPATDGGSPITTYQVSKDNGESWTDVGLDTSYTFTGLTNGTEYTFKVRAVNSEGPGEAASITAVPIMTYPPDAPQNFTATPGYRQAVLSWDPPASDGGTPIIKYQLSKDKGESWTDVHKDLTTYTFINLTNGIEYTFKVRAVNNKGPGAEASATAIPAAPVPSQKGIYSWGVNSYGQLGDGSLVNKDFPTHIGTEADWADWTMISAGYRHTAALQADGSLWTWGSNSNGQLGIGSDELRMNHPVQVGSDTDWVAVDAGYDFTVALKADGSLWAWGYAMGGFEYGGFSIDWNVPTLVDNENKWIAVSAGSGHTVAIREDGTLWGWGFNAHGELGSSGFDDYIDYTESPVQISSDRWIAVSAGDYFTIGLKEDGSLWAWGENDVGQLGNGSTENTSVPTRVGSEGDSWLAAETAPGSDHVVAIKADGSLWAWGGNEYGQLGRGYKDGVQQNPPPHPVPQQIGTDTDWVSVVAGMNLSAALKSDGSLWLWGIIGTDMEGANEPQRLEADGTWLDVACGSTYALAILQGEATVPGAPRNFTAIPGDGQITLSWTAPSSDGGSAIIRYEVSSDGGDTWTSVGTSTTYTFTGLTNGTEYTFKVRAVNNVGYGYAASVTAVPVAAPSGDFAGGSGTEDSPYLISTVTHLDNVRNYLDKHFRLTADLDLSDFTSGLGWEPFGTEEEPFTGTLDGAGHTISNLTIAHDSESMAAGLFAYTGETAEIRDLGLVSVSVSGSYNVGGLVGENYGKITGSYVIGNVTGFFGVGGLVGNNHGSISNSWAEGTVKDIDKVSGYYYGGLVGENANDSTISNCYANVTVNSPHSTTVGGLVGDNLGSITDSFAVGAVEAGTSAGGLVGSNSGYIEKCYATGNVVSKTIAGGLVAYNYRSINQSYATGNVSGKGQTGGLAGGNSGSIFNSYARGAVSGDEFIGGLVGFNIDSITNCYSTGAVSGKSYTGGLVGLNDTKSGSVINCYWDKETSGKSSSDGGTGKRTAEMKQQETYENWNFDALWGINSDNDGYPFLIWQVDENALTVPGVPRDFSATPGNGLMELSWIPPASDGGSEITHYEVFCGSEGRWVVADTNSSHTFTGLENGTTYTFKVRAVNSAGIGPEASLMATPVGVPSAPQNLTAIPDDGCVYLSWDAPANDGGDVINYYEVSGDNGTTWFKVRIGTSYTFSDLTNGIEYTFIVRAVNSVGAGEEASVTATPAAVPDVPQNLSAIPGDGQVTLSWEAPAYDGGSAIIRYEVYKDGDEDWTNVGLNTTYTITGLTNGVEYTFYVRAVNRVGEGEWEIVTATPLASATVPSTPQNLTAIPGDGKVTLTWNTPASDGGSEIVYYEVYKEGDDSWRNVGLVTSYIFDDLTNGIEYRFFVRAVNSVGPGAEASIKATPEAAPTITEPGAPRNLGILAGDGEARLIWEAPESDGGSPILRYEVKKDDEIDWTVVGLENGYTFINLTNGVEYTFYVRAVNSVGAGPAASITATPATIPSAPQNLTAMPGDGQVTLSWDAPANDGGAEITKYQVSIDAENWIDVDKDTTTYTFTDLTNGVEYTFYVRAVNRVGEGEWEIVTAIPEAAPVKTHTVNFYSNGALYASRTVTSGYALEGDWPANPTRSGYSFGGWFTGQNGSGTEYTRETIITADVDLYANWISSGGSSEIDTSTTTPATAYHAQLKSARGIEQTLQVAVEQNTVKASLEEDLWHERVQESMIIDMPSIPGVNTYLLEIPVQSLSTSGLMGSLSLETDAGSVTVPSNMLTGVTGTDGNNAQISISQGDKSNLPEDIKDKIGDRPLIQLSLSIDGEQTNWNNPDAPVKVSVPYTPTEEELANPESIVVCYIDGSGNVVTIPNGHYDPATGTVTFYTTHFSDFAVAYNKVIFNDVAQDAWYYRAVSFIAARGITEGTGKGNFSPAAQLTRGEFIVLMMRAYGIQPDSSPVDNFSDAGNTYYTGYLAAAKRLGISSGVGNNRFAPEKEITRQEMFTMLYNALEVIGQLPQGDSGKTLLDFSDAAEIASWAKEAMAYLVETGTVGGSSGKLDPTGTASRAEMAQVLYNLLAN